MMKKRYYCEIVPVIGNTDVSIAHAVAELAAFRKLHPPPPPLPPRQKRGKKNK
jgi:hypothetical protein